MSERPIPQFVSYPKSGRSWIRFMLARLDAHRDVRFHHDGFEFNDGARPPHDFNLAARLERYPEAARLIYLERDPRDVMVSLYHQVTGRFRSFFDYSGSLGEFIRDDYFGAPNLARFRAMWAEIIAVRGFLRLRYEDCHADPLAVLCRVVDYCGIEAAPAALEAAVEAARIDKMRALECAGTFPEPWLRPKNGHPKVREGKVGGYREAFSAEDIAWLDRVFGIDRRE